MIVVPAVRAVTMPLLSTVATEVLPELHAPFMVVSVSNVVYEVQAILVPVIGVGDIFKFSKLAEKQVPTV